MSPGWIPDTKLDATGPAELIRQATGEPALRERARALAARVEAEDGAGAVISTIDRLLRV